MTSVKSVTDTATGYISFQAAESRFLILAGMRRVCTIIVADLNVQSAVVRASMWLFWHVPVSGSGLPQRTTVNCRDARLVTRRITRDEVGCVLPKWPPPRIGTRLGEGRIPGASRPAPRQGRSAAIGRISLFLRKHIASTLNDVRRAPGSQATCRVSRRGLSISEQTDRPNLVGMWRDAF